MGGILPVVISFEENVPLSGGTFVPRAARVSLPTFVHSLKYIRGSSFPLPLSAAVRLSLLRQKRIDLFFSPALFTA